MAVDPKSRRKVLNQKKKIPSKSEISKKDRIYGIGALILIVLGAFLFYWFIIKDLIK